MHSTGDYTAAAADRATSPNCSSQPWKLFLRNAAADNTLSYFAIASASGASERRHAVRELLLAVPDEVAWCWAKAEYWRRRMTTLYATEAVKVSFPLWVSDPAINWLAELEEIVATDGSTGEVSCVPSKLGGITRVSNELKDDASPDIAAEIGAALANQIAFGIDNAFLGDGSTGANAAKVPDGLLSLSAGYQSVDTVSGVVNTDPFIAAIFKAQNVGARIDRWIMSPTTAETLSKLKKQSGSNENLISLVGDGLTIAGIPVLVNAAVDVDTVAWTPPGPRPCSAKIPRLSGSRLSTTTVSTSGLLPALGSLSCIRSRSFVCTTLPNPNWDN